MDESRQPLSRKVPFPSSKINPYRMIIVVRLVVIGFFFRYRILNPVNEAYALWLTSVICEIWFAVSWILDQFPKWLPINRETYLDRLSLRYRTSFSCLILHLYLFKYPLKYIAHSSCSCLKGRSSLWGTHDALFRITYDLHQLKDERHHNSRQCQHWSHLFLIS